MKQKFTITIEEEILDKFRDYTTSKGFSMSSVIEIQVKEWLKNEGVEIEPK